MPITKPPPATNGRRRSGCQKTSLGGLEGRSPPNAIRIRRHVRRIRKPCCARFPCAVSRPGAPRGREGNSVKIRKRTPQADFFDTLQPPILGGSFAFLFLFRFSLRPPTFTGALVSGAVSCIHSNLFAHLVLSKLILYAFLYNSSIVSRYIHKIFSTPILYPFLKPNQHRK